MQEFSDEKEATVRSACDQVISLFVMNNLKPFDGMTVLINLIGKILSDCRNRELVKRSIFESIDRLIIEYDAMKEKENPDEP
jgi:hypothetical protein